VGSEGCAYAGRSQLGHGQYLLLSLKFAWFEGCGGLLLWPDRPPGRGGRGRRFENYAFCRCFL